MQSVVVRIHHNIIEAAPTVLKSSASPKPGFLLFLVIKYGLWYALAKLRIAVFVVEQNCPYMELDDRDQEAIHVWLEDEDGIKAYLRVMDRGVESEHVSIGRVIAVKRRSGIGTQVLSEGIRVAKEYFAADQIYLEAQIYAKSFYEKSGFRQVSEKFLEDGIPHIKMLRAADT